MVSSCKNTAGFRKGFGSSSTDTQLWCLVVGLQGAGGSQQKGHVSEVEVAEAVMFDRTDLLIATCLCCNQSLFQRSTLQKVKRGDIVMGSKWRKREMFGHFCAVLKKIELGVKGSRSVI